MACRPSTMFLMLGLAALLGVGAGCHDMLHDPPLEADAAVRPDARPMRACPEALVSCASTLATSGEPALPSTREPFSLAWTVELEQVAQAIVLERSQLLAVRARAQGIVLLDLASGKERRAIDVREPLSWSISADADDNMYVVGKKLHSLSAAGFERWSAALPGRSAAYPGEPGVGSAPAVGAGLVYVATEFGVHALSTVNGGQRWMHAVAPGFRVRLAGRGDTLVSPTAGDGYLALDAATGEPRWRSRMCPHLLHSADPIATRAGFLLAEFDDDPGGGRPWRSSHFTMSVCGEPLASLPRYQFRSALEAADGRLLTLDGEGLWYGLSHAITGKRSDGFTLGIDASTTQLIRTDLLAIGADDFAYLLVASHPSPSTLGPETVSVYRLELATGAVDGVVPLGNLLDNQLVSASMDSRGVLYLTMRYSGKVMAIKTPSPGPAGRWSLPDGDMRGSRWLN
ncbi:MAG: PQQ-binding-like beta-propeller repeat protein [Deltaproteobacteria bacterium]|nr:PQQ-binding-like beta-propeller repeat protein [Deltaproteobacteria bacterium]